MKFMLDTNICIYTIKRKPETVYNHLKQHNPEDICISSVTYAELCHGVEKSEAKERNRIALTLLLSNINIMDFDSKAAEEYGRCRAFLESEGTPIGPLDMMIGSHAKSLNLIIVTNNVKEFKRIPDLTIENWTE